MSALQQETDDRTATCSYNRAGQDSAIEGNELQKIARDDKPQNRKKKKISKQIAPAV